MKEKIFDFFSDDKNLVIICATLICISLIFKGKIPGEQLSTVSSIVSGLFGVAVGRSMEKK